MYFTRAGIDDAHLHPWYYYLDLLVHTNNPSGFLWSELWLLLMALAGFILLDLAHFGYPAMTKVAAYVLILCALNAWYMMAHVIFMQVFGRNVLPVGKPWIEPKPAPEAQTAGATS